MRFYDRHADHYDQEHDPFLDDLALYRGFAQHCGGRVLEAMCGSGRIAVPLARAGIRLTGVDSSPAMIARARERAAAAGVGAAIEWITADLRAFRSRRRFNLAFIALNSFQHLLDVADQQAALQCLHAVLRPGGTLILDLMQPDVAGLLARDGLPSLQHSRPLADGSLRQTFVVQCPDLATQRIHCTFLYDTVAADGLVRRTSDSFTLRWFHRFEIEHLLARCGFTVECLYGSYALDPWPHDDEQLIVVARRDAP
jgi:SAM-dependent methyltransferase